jgi:hypothetical protein
MSDVLFAFLVDKVMAVRLGGQERAVVSRVRSILKLGEK